MSDVGIHQILVAASPGDAITNLALGTRDVLRRVGPSEIFAYHVAPGLMGDVIELHKYRSRHARNLLIFHASIGQPAVHEFLTSRAEALVLVYHNVTPAKYFEPYDLEFAELLALGRREIELLQPRVVQTIADSAFNARELEAIGYKDVRVVPPVVDFHRFAGIAPRATTLNHLRSTRDANPAVGRAAHAAQAPRLPGRDDALRRDVPRAAAGVDARGPPPDGAVHRARSASRSASWK